MKIATIVGARPQFIKASVVSRAFREMPGMTEVMIHTGQHYDGNMSAVFFQELEMAEPDYNLGIGSGSHGVQTGRQLIAIEEVLLAERPDWVLVYGDTNSTVAGALGAAKLNIALAHVEAGLRSHNRSMPEEINRIVTDHCSNLLFAPTTCAVANLAHEGIGGSSVHHVGDVMYDVALRFGQKASRTSSILDTLGLKPQSFILATVHRAANTDDPKRISIILEALAIVGADMPVVFPVHPRTRSVIERMGLASAVVSKPGWGNVRMLDPLGYLDMLMLEKNAALIATDSGGVQKEAFFYEVPCVTLREETEWRELVDAGWNRLCPPQSPGTVADTIRAAIHTRGQPLDEYGDGHAAERIARILAACQMSRLRCG